MAATATTWPHGLDPHLDAPDLAPLDGLPADELLAWAVGRFGDRFAVVTSFQAEGMVVLDLARRVDPGVRVLTLDTGRLPEETYEVIEAVRTGLGLEVEVITPDPADVAAMVARHGPNLFHKDPALRRLCCHVRKVAPLDRALAGVERLVDRPAPRRRPGPRRASPRPSGTTPTAASSSSTRWPTGPASRSGPTCAATACR